jgi:hypothetical protein
MREIFIRYASSEASELLPLPVVPPISTISDAPLFSKRRHDR